MGPIKIAMADMLITFMWVFFSSMFGLFASWIAIAIGVDTISWAPIVIITVIIFVFVFIFNIIGEYLGGASFNPAGTASFYAAGVGDDSLITMGVRFPAQTIGATSGALAIMEVIPERFKDMIGAPSLKVDIHTGAIAEGVLTFVITFVVLLILLKGPRNEIFRTWLLAISTVIILLPGTAYTGPSMNPANAFGWAYVNNWHNTWDQFYVYWICPFIGAILAAWVYRFFFPPPPPVKKVSKAKKAKKANKPKKA